LNVDTAAAKPLTLKAQVMSGLRWHAGGRLATQLLSWASTIVIFRLLSPADYGLLSMATVFVELGQRLNEMGMAASVIQAKEVSRTMLRQVLGLVVLINGLIFLLLLAATPIIAIYFSEPNLRLIVPVLSTQFLLHAFSVVPRALLVRDMNFRAVSVIDLYVAIAQTIVTFAMAWSGFGVWALVFGSLAGIIVRALGFNIASPFLVRPSFSFAGFGSQAKFGGYLTLSRLLWHIYSQADAFIIGRVLGKSLLGYYSVAMHLAALPMDKVSAMLNQLAFPAYSKIQANKELVATYALRSTHAVAFISFPLFAGMSVLAPEGVRVALGDKWLPAILPLQLLSLVVPFRMIQTMMSTAVNGMGHPEVNVLSLAIACVVMPIAFLIGVQWELKGVSIAWIVGYTAWFFIMLYESLPILGLSMGRFLSALRGPALMSGVMYAAVFAAKLGIQSWGGGPIVSLAASIPFGAVVYLGGMWLLLPNGVRDVMSLIRR
jgi:teichuronic acid exporter